MTVGLAFGVVEENVRWVIEMGFCMRRRRKISRPPKIVTKAMRKKRVMTCQR